MGGRKNIMKIEEMNNFIYNAEHERNTYIQYKDDFCNKDYKFECRYFKLIRNLDGDSTETVNKILKRLELVFCGKEKEIDLFDEEEKKRLHKLNIEFYGRIFKVSENIFVYKNYFLPENYFNPIVYFYSYDLSWFQSLEKIKKGNIIDAGAYIGDSALCFAKLTEGTVYAFEALEKNCKKIKETIKLNQQNNIEIINRAVGQKTYEAQIMENKNPNWSTMKPYEGRTYEDAEMILSMRNKLKYRWLNYM